MLSLIFTKINAGRDYKVGIEFPMGSMMGTGSWVERMFAISCLVVDDVCDIYDPSLNNIEIYRPAEIKKFLTGKGNAKKELMLKGLQQYML